jgi:hypothetical protein
MFHGKQPAALKEACGLPAGVSRFLLEETADADLNRLP